jgi:tetratricopeptide (TPR) repeat protein
MKKMIFNNVSNVFRAERLGTRAAGDAFRWLVLVLFPILFASCGEDWLDEKRDINLVVPSSLKDMRLMLNNSYPLVYDGRGLAELSCGDVYFTDQDWQGKIALERYAYIWSDAMFEETTFLAEWDYAYSQVLIANLVLETLEEIVPGSGEQDEWNDVNGSALFFRARAFFNLAQLFSKPYDAATADTDPGIPLQLSSDINVSSVRASVQETYERIIDDLEEASGLLDVTPAYSTNPSRPAAYGLLARCHLAMRSYAKALEYADLALGDHDALLDYNTLDAGRSYPMSLFNEEVIFHGQLSSSFAGFRSPTGKTDPALYEAYEENDLRRTVFFRENTDGSFSFKGNYTGGSSLFGGIATDELLLIRAEGYARVGDTGNALEDLNTLLEKRYKTGTFEPNVADNAGEAIAMVLEERRKELLMRGLRWTDLRRLNFEPEHAVTINRTVEDVTHSLAPGDPRYTLPIPDYVIQASGIEQNVR